MVVLKSDVVVCLIMYCYHLTRKILDVLKFDVAVRACEREHHSGLVTNLKSFSK